MQARTHFKVLETIECFFLTNMPAMFLSWEIKYFEFKEKGYDK